jgi:hypothetical protein
MQVTNDMIARGDVAVLPVGWQKFGTIHDALAALVRRLPGRGELMVQVAPNDPEGRGSTREVAMDFDVVCLRTGLTLAEAR